MFLSVLGGALGHPSAWHPQSKVDPSAWHTKFKVYLGLDLSSGTQFTIQAVAPGGAAPTSGAMSQSIAILNSRLNGQGFTGATVQQQGSIYIVVSVPNKSAEQIAPLLRSAVLRFRQVLYVATGYPEKLLKTPTPTPTPSTTSPSTSPSASPSSSASPKPSSSPKPSANPSPSSGKSAARHAGGGSGQASSARAISATASPSPSASAKPSASASASPSPSPTPSPG